MPRAYQAGEGPKKKTKKRGRGKPVNAILYEDGSVRITGPRGSTGVSNVGEGGSSRGGYGTVRQFGPSNVRLPDFASGEKKARTAYTRTGPALGLSRKKKTVRRAGTAVSRKKTTKRRTAK